LSSLFFGGNPTPSKQVKILETNNENQENTNKIQENFNKSSNLEFKILTTKRYGGIDLCGIIGRIRTNCEKLKFWKFVEKKECGFIRENYNENKKNNCNKFLHNLDAVFNKKISENLFKITSF